MVVGRHTYYITEVVSTRGNAGMTISVFHSNWSHFVLKNID